MIDPLLQPLKINHLTLKNRIVSTPHAPAYAENGMPGERYQRYHEEKAKGGLSMTMFGGSSCIGPDSPSVFGQLYVGEDRVIPYFQQFAERIHRYDCRIMCQISHLGRRTVWNNGDWLPVVAPSRVREPAHRAFPKVMDQNDINRVIGYYAEAAYRCKEGDLDGCDILSHGHLPGQFLSPDTNHRSDKYGGSLKNRLRFTLELLEAVRHRVGDNFLVGLRSEMTSGAPDGLTVEESLEALQIVDRSGFIDFVTLNFGQIDTDYHLSRHIPPMGSKLAPWAQLSGEFRSHLNLPVIHACRIADVSSARHAINAGMLDLVGMTRAHIADPHLVNKIERGEEDRIRPCVGAGYCLDRIYGEGEALCIHNVATGREKHLPHVIAPNCAEVKKCVVVGGGPAGLEAARVLGLRGHDVILFEATQRLGGQLVLAAKATWRKEIIGIVDWYERELEHIGVTVKWNTLADTGKIMSENPDIVIIASGGIPDTDFVEGGDACLSVQDVLSGSPLTGNILVYDDSGTHPGPSCADFLSEQESVQVELVTPDRHAAAEMGGLNYPIYYENFYRKGVTVTPNHRLKKVIKENNLLKVIFANEFGGPDIERTVNYIVVEHGNLPIEELYLDLKGDSKNNGNIDYQALLDQQVQPQTTSTNGYLLYRVGDAIASRNIHAAIYDSLRLCKDI